MQAPPVPPSIVPIARRELLWLALILAGGLAARGLALAVLRQPVVSDGAAYLEMVRTVLAGREMLDIYGNRALYSPGYPFALMPFMAVLGPEPWVGRLVNMLLAASSILMLWWLGRRATGRPLVGLVAAFGLAFLIPAVAGVELLERENLSLPLLLAHLCLCVAMLTTRRPLAVAIVGGLVFACGLYGGVSMVLTGACFLAALAYRRESWGAAARQAFAFAIACALLVAPYLLRNERAVGAPMFSTNGGINLYIGNNPAADGYFVGIDRTPMAAGWEAFRRAHGEAGTSRALQQMAIGYALAHPGRTLALDARKLWLFWAPDTPDAGDEDHGAAVNAVRWAGALQHVVILLLAVVALARWGGLAPGVRLAVLAVLAVWGLQTGFYMITRYRLPAMPLVILLAAIPIADGLERLVRRAPLSGASASD